MPSWLHIHSSIAPAAKTPPSSAYSTLPSMLQATVGSRPPAGSGTLLPDVGEHEHPGPVGRLHAARLDARGPGQGGLLVDDLATEGQLDGPALVFERAEIARGVTDLGQRPRSGFRRSRRDARRSSPACRCAAAGSATRWPARSRTRRRGGRRGRSRRSPSAACASSRACLTSSLWRKQPGELGRQRSRGRRAGR